jgi:ankyrin repeat protein
MPQPLLAERIAAGRTDLVLETIESGSMPVSASVDGATLLQWCAWYGDVTAVRVLLAHGAAVEELGPNLGLLGAAFHGHWRLCQFLVERGARAGHADGETGETPLHAALTNEDRERYDLVIAVLLAGGADPNAATLPDRPTGSLMRDGRTRGSVRHAAHDTHAARRRR